MELRKAILPLYIVAKVLCTSPFSLKPLWPSFFGTIITICQAIGYTIFHLWMVNRDLTAESTKNLVRQLIDSYNRYSGFCAFLFLVVISTWNQAKIVKVIQNIEDVDRMLEQKLDTHIDNRFWRRYKLIPFSSILSSHNSIFNRNVMLQICICIVTISFLEWRNCLMYIQDSVPFSEYCIFMCLSTFFVFIPFPENWK